VNAALHLTVSNTTETVTPASASVFSITMSHILAIHTAYSNGFQTVLFLEDDVVLDLLPFWEDSLDKYVGQLPKGWLASQVGHTTAKYLREPPLPQRVGANRARYRQGHEWGAFAYLLSRRGMEIIAQKYWDLGWRARHCQLGRASCRLYRGTASR
jgi:hypothetical protein